jgi:hypothetical protein
MDYTDFFSESDIATFKRVKAGSMRLSRIAREQAMNMVGGHTALGKEFVYTRLGTFRLAMAANTDNSTERAAHDDAGVTTIIMGDDDAMGEWFWRHGVWDGVPAWKQRIAKALD